MIQSWLLLTDQGSAENLFVLRYLSSSFLWIKNTDEYFALLQIQHHFEEKQIMQVRLSTQHNLHCISKSQNAHVLFRIRSELRMEAIY